VTILAPADEIPELWLTDLAVHTEARVSFPDSVAPMARVLSLDALAGLTVGPGRLDLRVVDDPYLAGEYTVDGRSGALEVSRGGRPTATLTSAGLSALVYGVLDPEELPLRGLGQLDTDAVTELRTLFPRATPFIGAYF